MSLRQRLTTLLNRASAETPDVQTPARDAHTPGPFADLETPDILRRLADIQASMARLSAASDLERLAAPGGTFADYMENEGREIALCRELTRRGVPIPRPIDPDPAPRRDGRAR